MSMIIAKPKEIIEYSLGKCCCDIMKRAISSAMIRLNSLHGYMEMDIRDGQGMRRTYNVNYCPFCGKNINK